MFMVTQVMDAVEKALMLTQTGHTTLCLSEQQLLSCSATAWKTHPDWPLPHKELPLEETDWDHSMSTAVSRDTLVRLVAPTGLLSRSCGGVV